jgi:hypothetical protein
MPRRPKDASSAGEDLKKAPPPDTGVLWPLIRGQLNVMKYPPIPPKTTQRMATGGSSAWRHQIRPIRNTAERWKSADKKKPADAAKGTSGSSLREINP